MQKHVTYANHKVGSLPTSSCIFSVYTWKINLHDKRGHFVFVYGGFLYLSQYHDLTNENRPKQAKNMTPWYKGIEPKPVLRTIFFISAQETLV